MIELNSERGLFITGEIVRYIIKSNIDILYANWIAGFLYAKGISNDSIDFALQKHITKEPTYEYNYFDFVMWYEENIEHLVNGGLSLKEQWLNG